MITYYNKYAKEYNKLFPNARGIDKKVEKSNPSYLLHEDYDIILTKSTYSSLKSIAINYAYGNCGFLIEIGSKFIFTTTQIIYIHKHFIDEGLNVKSIWKISNMEKGRDYAREQQYFSDLYKDICYAEMNEAL